MPSEPSSPNGRSSAADQAHDRGRDVSPWDRARTLLGLPSSKDGPIATGAWAQSSRMASFNEPAPLDEGAQKFGDVSAEHEHIEEMPAVSSDGRAPQLSRPSLTDLGSQPNVWLRPDDDPSVAAEARVVPADTTAEAPGDGYMSSDPRLARLSTTQSEPRTSARDVNVTHLTHTVRRSEVAALDSDGLEDNTSDTTLGDRRRESVESSIRDNAMARALDGSVRFPADGDGPQITDRLTDGEDFSERFEQLRRTVRNLEISLASHLAGQGGHTDRHDRPSSRVMLVTPGDNASTARRAFWDRRHIGRLSLGIGR